MLKIKQEDISTINPCDIVAPEGAKMGYSVGLEDLIKADCTSKKLDILHKIIFQLENKHNVNLDLNRDAAVLESIIQTDDTRIQAKAAELLHHYIRSIKVDTSIKNKNEGIASSSQLMKFCSQIHAPICKYLLTNVVAGEFCTSFYCYLLALCSSRRVFADLVDKFKNVLNDYIGSYDASKGPVDLPSETARVVIGIMKTLLALTKSFGTPPAPFDSLVAIASLVCSITNAHICRLYSYNLIAFLLRKASSRQEVADTLPSLRPPQIDQVYALLKEANHSEDNVCEYKFLYSPPADKLNGNAPNFDKSSSDKRMNETGIENSELHTPIAPHKGKRRVVPSAALVLKKPKRSNTLEKAPQDALKFKSEWLKQLEMQFSRTTTCGEEYDREAWKQKLQVLQDIIIGVESVDVLSIAHLDQQLVSLLENGIKHESAIPVMQALLELFCSLTQRCWPNLISRCKSGPLCEQIFDKLKESNKQIQIWGMVAVGLMIKQSTDSSIVDLVKRSLTCISPHAKVAMCNIINGQAALLKRASNVAEHLQPYKNVLLPILCALSSDKFPKVRTAAQLAHCALENPACVTQMYFPTPKKKHVSPKKDYRKGARPAASTKLASKIVMRRLLNTQAISNKPISPDATTPVPQVPTQETDTANKSTTVSASYLEAHGHAPENSATIQNKAYKTLLDHVQASILSQIENGQDMAQGIQELGTWVKDNKQTATQVVDSLLEFINEKTNGFNEHSKLVKRAIFDLYSEMIALNLGLDSLKLLTRIMANQVMSSKGALLLQRLLELYDCDVIWAIVLDVVKMDEREEVATNVINLIGFQCRTSTSIGDVGNTTRSQLINYLASAYAREAGNVSTIAAKVLKIIASILDVNIILNYLEPTLRQQVANAIVPIEKKQDTLEPSDNDDWDRISTRWNFGYTSCCLRLEKEISKDLYICMFQSKNTSNLKRACVFWKVFIKQGSRKCCKMLYETDNLRLDLLVWLCHTLLSRVADRIVMEALSILCQEMKQRTLHFTRDESQLVLDVLAVFKGQVTSDFVDGVFNVLPHQDDVIEFAKYHYSSDQCNAILKEPIQQWLELAKQNQSIRESLDSASIAMQPQQSVNEPTSSLDTVAPEIKSPVVNRTRNILDTVEYDAVDTITQDHCMAPTDSGHQSESVPEQEIPPVSTPVVMRNAIECPLLVDRVTRVTIEPVELKCTTIETVVDGLEEEPPNAIQHPQAPVCQDIVAIEQCTSPIPITARMEKGTNCHHALADAQTSPILLHNSNSLDSPRNVNDSSGNASEGSVETAENPNSATESIGMQETAESDLHNLIESCRRLSYEIQSVGNGSRCSNTTRQAPNSSNTNSPKSSGTNTSRKSSILVESQRPSRSSSALGEIVIHSAAKGVQQQVITSDDENLGNASIFNDCPMVEHAQSLEPPSTTTSCIDKYSLGTSALDRVVNRISIQSSRHEAGIVESIGWLLSECSWLANVCLLTNYDDYKGLVPSIFSRGLVETCSSTSNNILEWVEGKEKILPHLAPILIDVCHLAILRLCRHVEVCCQSQGPYQEAVSAVTCLLEIFTVAIIPFQQRHRIHFCAIIVHCLALPKACFGNCDFYRRLTDLIKTTCANLDIESLAQVLLCNLEINSKSLKRGEGGRILLAMLRFTRILQSQVLEKLQTSHVSPKIQTQLDESHRNFVQLLSVPRGACTLDKKMNDALESTNTLLRSIKS
ncbi:bifunctional Armadillo-type fold/Armadillo-like helical [Babesia duncani]|uniref:Bifunctional Armadillo-type fold/Armadillo-like helical n=1 Tax=Babesia duncani TaxID=323732 RepID=A0AAD9UPV3_9APIC|nr:bifunctional Armadillo-type fold/Armadillo-like helical [Babesia duncani]